MNNDMKRKMEELVQRCERDLGWRIDADKRHWVVYPPKPYAPIVISRTPSDPFAFKNARADVNKVLRQMGKPEIMK